MIGALYKYFVLNCISAKLIIFIDFYMPKCNRVNNHKQRNPIVWGVKWSIKVFDFLTSFAFLSFGKVLLGYSIQLIFNRVCLFCFLSDTLASWVVKMSKSSVANCLLMFKGCFRETFLSFFFFLHKWCVTFVCIPFYVSFSFNFLIRYCNLNNFFFCCLPAEWNCLYWILKTYVHIWLIIKTL